MELDFNDYEEIGKIMDNLSYFNTLTDEVKLLEKSNLIPIPFMTTDKDYVYIAMSEVNSLKCHIVRMSKDYEVKDLNWFVGTNKEVSSKMIELMNKGE